MMVCAATAAALGTHANCDEVDCSPVGVRQLLCVIMTPSPVTHPPSLPATGHDGRPAPLVPSQLASLGLRHEAHGATKPTTNLQELADDLSLRFSQLYAARSQPPPTTTAAAAGPATAVATRSAARTGTASTLLQEAGAIGFAEFAGVIAALALKYRFELPPYFTLIIRSLTTLEGFALVVDPSARYSIARTAVKVRDLAP